MRGEEDTWILFNPDIVLAFFERDLHFRSKKRLRGTGREALAFFINVLVEFIDISGPL
jgi:hypothetical protein